MKINRFEDLEVWMEARKLVNMVYRLTDKSPFKKDFGLRDQIQRAAVSCMSNTAEGFDSGSNHYFIQYLLYVRRSSSEVRSILYIALDREYITKEEFNETYQQAEKVGKLANGFIRYLKTSKRANEQTSKRTNGFTFIELLITLAVIAICFLPLMRMFSASLEQVYTTSDLTTARYLAQEGMERVKNLGFTEAQLEALGDVWEPALDKPPLEINGKYWRTLRKPVKATDPLEIRIQVYQITSKPANQQTSKPITEVVTLVEDLDWTAVE